jgi:hypothetical protein
MSVSKNQLDYAAPPARRSAIRKTAIWAFFLGLVSVVSSAYEEQFLTFIGDLPKSLQLCLVVVVRVLPLVACFSLATLARLQITRVGYGPRGSETLLLFAVLLGVMGAFALAFHIGLILFTLGGPYDL